MAQLYFYVYEFSFYFLQIDHSLALVDLGIERHVPNLEVCRDSLLSLNTLVYECHVTENLSLDDVSKMAVSSKQRELVRICFSL